jgi:SAM-dependent methyltransferase
MPFLKKCFQESSVNVPMAKYYDWRSRRVLDSKDGCPLDQWLAGGNESQFGIHPGGFRVFLDPSEIRLSDEYSEGDPYVVNDEGGQRNSFHLRRFDCTLQLIEEATGGRATTQRICDLGCGQGHITAAIQKSYSNAEISGLDYSISAITRAAESCKEIDFVVANAYEPPYCPEYFDIVVCNNLWEHVPDPLRLLGAISRILRTDGSLILSTPSRYRLRNLLRVLRGRSVVFTSNHHITEYSVGQVIEQLQFGGFETKVVSPPMQRSCNTLRGLAAFGILMPILRLFLRSVGSHHSLEETVFYLARKRFDYGAR